MRGLINLDKEITFVAIEKQQAFPGQGSTSTFRTGEGFGIWQGLLAGLQLEFVVVPPRTWQKMLIPGKAGETKARSQRK